MRKKFRLSFLPVMIGLLVSPLMATNAQAAITWSELRIFGTNNQVANESGAFNGLTAADQVNQLNSLNGLGIEADARIGSWLKVGTRYRGIWTLNTPNNAPNPPTSFVAIQQSQGGAFFRLPLLDTSFLQLDLFGEVGVENTHIDVKTTGAGEGTFTKNGSFYQRAGGSVGIGWKAIKFFFEAGQEWNYLDNMDFSGTLSNNIRSLDLSGPYFAGGIIISGIPGWIKPGGITTQE